MLSQNWLTLLSVLVSGSMVFTLAATLFLYTKYKLGQKSTVMNTQPAATVNDVLSLGEAIDLMSETHVQQSKSVKKKIRFSKAIGNGAE